MNKVLMFSLVNQLINYEEFYYTFSLLVARRIKIELKLCMHF